MPLGPPSCSRTNACPASPLDLRRGHDLDGRQPEGEIDQEQVVAGQDGSGHVAEEPEQLLAQLRVPRLLKLHPGDIGSGCLEVGREDRAFVSPRNKNRDMPAASRIFPARERWSRPPRNHCPPGHARQDGRALRPPLIVAFCGRKSRPIVRSFRRFSRGIAPRCDEKRQRIGKRAACRYGGAAPIHPARVRLEPQSAALRCPRITPRDQSVRVADEHSDPAPEVCGEIQLTCGHMCGIVR